LLSIAQTGAGDQQRTPGQAQAGVFRPGQDDSAGHDRYGADHQPTIYVLLEDHPGRVRTLSRFNSSAASDAELCARPKSSSTGPTMPPDSTAAASQGRSVWLSPAEA
jgi:hypothetical protein